jgi:hypothetical protein
MVSAHHSHGVNARWVAVLVVDREHHAEQILDVTSGLATQRCCGARTQQPHRPCWRRRPGAQGPLMLRRRGDSSVRYVASLPFRLLAACWTSHERNPPITPVSGHHPLGMNSVLAASDGQQRASPPWLPSPFQARDRCSHIGPHPVDGAVVFAATTPAQRGCWHENSPVSLYSCSTLCLRRLPLPTRGDRHRGPLVPALRPLAMSRSSSPSAGRGRPRHRLPLGAAVHAAAGRGCPPMAARRWRSLVGRRDVLKVVGRWR